MRKAFGTDPANLVVQVAPCIRPPHYEVDFAAQIVRQAREAGVRDIFDCGTCTASHPEVYYSVPPRKRPHRTSPRLGRNHLPEVETMAGSFCHGYCPFNNRGVREERAIP